MGSSLATAQSKVQTFSVTLDWPDQTVPSVAALEHQLLAMLSSTAQLLRWAIVKTVDNPNGGRQLFVEGAFLTQSLSLQ